MHTQIGKWGHSLAVRIPKAFASQARLAEGQEIELTVADGQLIITPIHREYTLDALLSYITRENLHGETDTGMPIGHEVW